jgi:hypothetical protein
VRWPTHARDTRVNRLPHQTTRAGFSAEYHAGMKRFVESNAFTCLSIHWRRERACLILGANRTERYVNLIDVMNLSRSLFQLQHLSTTVYQICFQLSESIVYSMSSFRMSGAVIMELSTQYLEEKSWHTPKSDTASPPMVSFAHKYWSSFQMHSRSISRGHIRYC